MRYKIVKSKTKKMANSILFGFFVFLFFTLAFFWSYYLGVQKRNAIEGGVIVEAEIVGVWYDESNGRGSWCNLYEYIDDNGVRYTGRVLPLFEREEEAKARIGRKVKIYIDGKGNSITVGSAPGDKESIVVAIIFMLATIAMLVKYISLEIKYKKERLLIEQDTTEMEEKSIAGSFLTDLQKFNAKKEETTDIQQDETTTLEHKEI